MVRDDGVRKRPLAISYLITEPSERLRAREHRGDSYSQSPRSWLSRWWWWRPVRGGGDVDARSNQVELSSDPVATLAAALTAADACIARSLPTLRLRGNVSSVRIFVFLSLLLHRVPVPVPVLDLVPLATSKFGSRVNPTCPTNARSHTARSCDRSNNAAASPHAPPPAATSFPSRRAASRAFSRSPSTVPSGRVSPRA